MRACGMQTVDITRVGDPCHRFPVTVVLPIATASPWLFQQWKSPSPKGDGPRL